MRYFLLVIFCLGFSHAALSDESQNTRLKGDPRAVDAIERMIDRFGGAKVWSRARTLYVEYDGWRLEPNEPVVERAWRDLHAPRQRSEFEGRSFLRIYAISPEFGWISRNGEIEEFDAERHQATVARYPFGFYTSLRTLAVGDPRIRLEWQAPDRVVVKTDDGRERGWWRVDASGALIKWGAAYPSGTVEYVYGPMKAFGTINFPAWGASTDGSWRWTYTDVDLRVEPIPFSVARRPASE